MVSGVGEVTSYIPSVKKKKLYFVTVDKHKFISFTQVSTDSNSRFSYEIYTYAPAHGAIFESNCFRQFKLDLKTYHCGYKIIGISYFKSVVWLLSVTSAQLTTRKLAER